MHLHLPKPLHGWREFAGEVGIIVLGVLIALGAEQVVEDLHWHNEVEDVREALKTELNYDLGVVAYRQAQQPCVERRFVEINAWLDSIRTGRPITLTDRIGGPSNYPFHSNVWEIVKSGQAAEHMSLADKIDYGEIYDVFQNISNLQQREVDAWRILAEADGARSLSDADIRRVRYAASIVSNRSVIYANNLNEIAPAVVRLRLSPDRLKDNYLERTKRFCRSILPKN